MGYWIGEHADLITLSGEGRPAFAPDPDPDPLTPNQKTRATISTLARMLAFGCALFTVILLTLSAWITYRLHDILTSWPHVQAQVLSSEIYSQSVTIGGPNGSITRSTVYGFRCNVSYSVAARNYQSQVDIGYQNGDRSEMVSWFGRIPRGDRIEIAYSPKDPTHIRFAGDIATAYAPGLLLLRYIAWLAAIGALMFLLSQRLRLPSSDADLALPTLQTGSPLLH
jgi:Protein of unknown function (DUF3592)